MKLIIPRLILILALLGLTLSIHFDCAHDHHDLDLDIDEDDKDDPFEGRMLQSEYANIRIYADYSLLDSALEPEVQAYIKEELMPPVINYYQQLLKVIPRAKKLTYKKDSLCGLTTPESFKDEGVDADIVFIIDASYEADSNYIAYARACTIQNGDNRPTFGNAHFNLKYVKVGNEKTHDENVLVALHELAHVFGISKGLYDFYYDPVAGKTRKGHVVSREINGNVVFLVDVEPLTSKLREFYSCPTLEGALMENEGESMSASHLERRVFYSEIMTAGEMEEARLSEFMLAFLEGTGWYKGNYSMTEPVYWGKGKGCDFYYSPCVDRKTFNPSFEEFCPSLAETGCSVTRKLGATCGASSKTSTQLDDSFNYWGNGSIVLDIFADNCPYFVPNSNKDCEDPTHQLSALLQEESYGMGSKCFSGTLINPLKKLNKKTNYCFKTTCDRQSDGRFFLQVQIGSASVTCKTSGSISVPGFLGQMDCPDPSEYCNTYGKTFCERGCMGKGQCVNDACVCDDGWGGKSCGMKAYTHKCSRCANETLKTSCYGDGCFCNPSDPLCVNDRQPIAIGDRGDSGKGSTGTGSSNDSGTKGGSSTGSSSSITNGGGKGTTESGSYNKLNSGAMMSMIQMVLAMLAYTLLC